MYYVYIIQDKFGTRHYTGATQDLKKRLMQHNRGNTKSTSAYGPFIVGWYCAFSNKEKAYRFERYLKSGSGFAFARKRLL